MRKSDVSLLLSLFSALAVMFGRAAAMMVVLVVVSYLVGRFGALATTGRGVRSPRHHGAVSKTVSIRLEDDQERRWAIFAGRRNKTIEEWVRGQMEAIIEAETPGRINRAIVRQPPPPPEPSRHCQFCGDELDPHSTYRRKYCDDTCRVRAWRRRRYQPQDLVQDDSSQRPPTGIAHPGS